MFSPQLADQALVLVRRIVRDIVRTYGEVVDYQELLESCQVQNLTAGAERSQQELFARVERLQALADELREVGVDLKDWEAGVVDFPGLLDGREVLLCWQHGEDRVKYWHGVCEDCAAPAAGVAGRKAVRRRGLTPGKLGTDPSFQTLPMHETRVRPQFSQFSPVFGASALSPHGSIPNHAIAPRGRSALVGGAALP